jgi:hypothetical protein
VELPERASTAFDAAESVALEAFPFDVEVSLLLEEGSLKSRVTIVTVGALLMNIVAQYGSVREGMSYIARDAKAVAGHINEAVRETLDIPSTAVSWSRRDGGLARQIERTMERVGSGELTPEQGTDRVMTLLRRAGIRADDTVTYQIRTEIHSIPVVRPKWRRYELTAHQLTMQPIEGIEFPHGSLDSPDRPDEPAHPEPKRRIEVAREGPHRRKRVRVS